MKPTLSFWIQRELGMIALKSFGTSLTTWMSPGDGVKGSLEIEKVQNLVENKLKICLFEQDLHWKNAPPILCWFYFRQRRLHALIRRKAEKRIKDWIDGSKKALLVSGVQVGKIYSIRRCLMEAGCNYLEINLIEQPVMSPWLRPRSSLHLLNLTNR